MAARLRLLERLGVPDQGLRDLPDDPLGAG